MALKLIATNKLTASSFIPLLTFPLSRPPTSSNIPIIVDHSIETIERSVNATVANGG